MWPFWCHFVAVFVCGRFGWGRFGCTPYYYLNRLSCFYSSDHCKCYLHSLVTPVYLCVPFVALFSWFDKLNDDDYYYLPWTNYYHLPHLADSSGLVSVHFEYTYSNWIARGDSTCLAVSSRYAAFSIYSNQLTIGQHRDGKRSVVAWVRRLLQ